MNITPIYTHPSRYLVRGAPTVAIILHEVNEPLGALGSRIGTNLINALKPTAHQSYHYAVDGAAVHSFVDPAMAARALGDTEILTGWSVQAGFVGVDPDKYTINIAVIVGSAPIGDNLCIPCCGREYSPVMMWNLRRLIHQLADDYEIDVSGDSLWLHGDELCDICLEDLRVPPEVITPGEEDWLCDRLGSLPEGDNPQPRMCNTMVISPDCEIYPLDDGDWEIYTVQGACQTGRQTPGNVASGAYAVASGVSSVASGEGSHATGKGAVASGPHAQSHGQNTVASGSSSFAEGDTTVASGPESHAEGYTTLASGDASHAEGRNAVASGANSHAQNRDTLASGAFSHAEGRGTIASGVASHAEGQGSVAQGNWSHASGYLTLASQPTAVASGLATIADGANSSARGEVTQTKARNAEAWGKGAVASHHAEQASSDGPFSNLGDAQRRIFHMKLECEHDTSGWFALSTWGEAPGILMEIGAAFNLRAQIVGVTEDAAQRWVYNLEAAVSQPGPNAANLLVDAFAVTSVYESDANYDAQVYANTSSGRVEIRVGRTAGDAYNIRWFAIVEIAQVIFQGVAP
jgi:hypothetical protein